MRVFQSPNPSISYTISTANHQSYLGQKELLREWTKQQRLDFLLSLFSSRKIPKSFGAQGKTGLFLETPEDPTLNQISTPTPSVGLSAFRPLAASLPGCSRLNTPSERVAHQLHSGEHGGQWGNTRLGGHTNTPSFVSDSLILWHQNHLTITSLPIARHANTYW